MKYEFNRHVEVMLGPVTDLTGEISPRGFRFWGSKGSVFVEVSEFETEQDGYWTMIRTPCLAFSFQRVGWLYSATVVYRDKSMDADLGVDRQRIWLGDRFVFQTTNEEWQRFLRNSDASIGHF